MLARRTLLLADDSPTIRKVVSLTFGDEGMRVLTAADGGEALVQLEQTVPDVVLADVHMPAPGGYELCARIKRDARTARVPVMLLVGTFEEFDEAEARKAGADGVLTKPFQSIRELVNKVGGLLGGHPEHNAVGADAREDEAARAAATHAPAAPSPLRAAPDEDARVPVFAGFDADDESIESMPADDYVAAGRERARSAFAEFAPAEESFARGVAAGGVEAVGVGEAVAYGAPERARAQEVSGRAAPAQGAQTAAGFSPRPSHPFAEDSLLELGDFDSPQARGASEDDDFILDIGGDYGAVAATPAGVAADDALSAELIAGNAEPAADLEISPANLSHAWSDAPQFELSPEAESLASPPAHEVTADAEHVEPEFAVEPQSSENAEPVFESKAESVVSTATAGVPVAESAPRPSADTTAGAREASAGAQQLSPEAVDAIARRVVELLSDSAVREIAWEVVPELAERLIRQRLEEEKTRAS